MSLFLVRWGKFVLVLWLEMVEEVLEDEALPITSVSAFLRLITDLRDRLEIFEAWIVSNNVYQTVEHWLSPAVRNFLSKHKQIAIFLCLSQAAFIFYVPGKFCVCPISSSAGKLTSVMIQVARAQVARAHVALRSWIVSYLNSFKFQEPLWAVQKKWERRAAVSSSTRAADKLASWGRRTADYSYLLLILSLPRTSC